MKEMLQIFNNSINQTQSSPSTDLTKLFQSLFPAWPTIVATILAVTVLMIVLTKYIWKPFKKYVTDRSNFIQSNIDASTQQKVDAVNDRKKAINELNVARQEANTIVENAKKSALLLHEDIIGKAHEQKQQILDDAKLDIKNQKAKLYQDTRNEIISVAFNAAEKLIEKNIDTKTNKKIIEDYLKNNEK